MKRNSKTVRFSGDYGSPGGVEYGDRMPTSWSSERVANPNVRRHVGGAAFMPFNSLRALPSKWDDAERWITSPISSYGASAQILRRPKSKSGPMGLTSGVTLPHGSISIRYNVKTSGGEISSRGIFILVNFDPGRVLKNSLILYMTWVEKISGMGVLFLYINFIVECV